MHDCTTRVPLDTDRADRVGLIGVGPSYIAETKSLMREKGGDYGPSPPILGSKSRV